MPRLQQLLRRPHASRSVDRLDANHIWPLRQHLAQTAAACNRKQMRFLPIIVNAVEQTNGKVHIH